MSRKLFRTAPPAFASLQEIACAAMHDLTTENGFSRDKQGRLPIPAGFMVSMPNCEIRQAFPSARSILRYMKANPLRQGEFWGGWKDNGMTALDISLRLDSRDDAMELARIFRQTAIYDLANRENIARPKTAALQGHAGIGGLQAHSIGDIYPWTIVGIGADPLRWFAMHCETSHKMPIRDTYREADEDARRMLARETSGSAYDVMSEIANSPAKMAEMSQA